MNEFTQRPTGHRDTIAVHCGEKRWMGSITTPIDYTSTFVFKDVAEMVAFANGEIDHYEYGRYGNPTREAAELKLAALEGAERCVLFDCGMSAVSATILSNCTQGQHIIITDDAYKQTLALVKHVMPRFGISCTVVPMGDYEAMEKAVTPVHGHDHLRIADQSVSQYCRCRRRLCGSRGAHNVLSVIDSTFATPYNTRPLEQGVDIVIQSAHQIPGRTQRRPSRRRLRIGEGDGTDLPVAPHDRRRHRSDELLPSDSRAEDFRHADGTAEQHRACRLPNSWKNSPRSGASTIPDCPAIGNTNSPRNR